MCPTEPAAVVWAVQFATFTFHPWPVRRHDLDHPDELRIDLDPQPGTDFGDASAPLMNSVRCWTSSVDCAAGPRPPAAADCMSSSPSSPAWTFTQVRRAAIACRP